MQPVQWIDMEKDKNNEIDFGRWDKRIKMMAAMISDESQSVADLGCGRMLLKEYLPDSKAYYPVDYCYRGEDNIICDFNRHEFPDISVDTVFASGILEHVVDYTWFIEQMCKTASCEVILSYVCTEKGNNETVRSIIQNGYHIDWVNSLSEKTIMELFKKNHFLLKYRKPNNGNEYVMKFVRTDGDQSAACRGYCYSDERAVQMLIYLLKENNIKKVIASPGATNLTFIASLEYDGSFEMYSCPDERSAAYMACGMAAESGEPVVISCTGATASREYLAGLTEAYYRKLPVLAVTSTQSLVNTDNLSPQFIDRTVLPKDAARCSVQIQYIRGKTDEWDCMLKMNRAIHELIRSGGGPVHINLTTAYSMNFFVEKLPDTRVIKHYDIKSDFPPIKERYTRIAITCGAKWKWTQELNQAMDDFCSTYNAVVLVDHASGYSGKYKIHPTILMAQENADSSLFCPDLLIHIGEQSADYYTYNKLKQSREVWRISEDGQIRDTFKGLTKIFEMPEIDFFHYYAEGKGKENTYFAQCQCAIRNLYKRIPPLPFSNIWAASVMAPILPENAVIHFGLSNSMRAWTFFEFQNENIRSYANVGCRGIDGVISTIGGASLVHPDVLYFVVLGDLAFFYDMNVLGNRHLSANLRIILVNNGGGTEFHLYQHMGNRVMGNEVGNFVAADGHYGRKSHNFVRHYAQDLGFEYFSAENKEEFYRILKRFLTKEVTEQPMLLEVFTEDRYESEALKLIRNLGDS